MTLKAKKKNYIKVLYDLFITEGHKFISYAIMCYPRKIKSLLLLLLTVKSSQDTFCWVSTEEKEGMSNYF